MKSLKDQLRDGKHVLLHQVRNCAGRVNRQLRAPEPYPLLRRPRVLVVGIYLAAKPNLAGHLVRAYAAARSCAVDQRWIAIDGLHQSAHVRTVTCRTVNGFAPKFTLLNRLFETLDLSVYDYVVVSDDDVRVRRGFLDSLIGCQEHFDFALAQPARTWTSYNDHKIVRRDPRYLARQTWFVEIGPVFSMQRRALPLVLPFDEQSPMGYGYDFVWPCVLREAGMTMGIIDCCPLDHTQRLRSRYYDAQKELAVMEAFLRERPHVSRAQAMQSVRGFA